MPDGASGHRPGGPDLARRRGPGTEHGGTDRTSTGQRDQDGRGDGHRGQDRTHLINRSDRPVSTSSVRPARSQLAQMFWLAVREEKLGDGVGLAAWPVPSVWVVVP